MSAVTVDGDALIDPRFRKLATYAGYADARHALGAMIFVWAHCTARNIDKLDRETLGALLELEPKVAANALVRSGLGVAMRGGKGGATLRIAGCSGRIEWKELQRKNKVAAAKSRWDKQLRDAGALPLDSDCNAISVSQSVSQSVSPPPTEGTPLPPQGGKGSSLPGKALGLADLLAELVAARSQVDPRASKGWAKTRVTWATDLGKLHRLDGQAWTLIEQVMRDLQTSFYAKNIRSGKSMRARFGLCADYAAEERTKRNGHGKRTGDGKRLSRGQQIALEAEEEERAERERETEK